MQGSNMQDSSTEMRTSNLGGMLPEQLVSELMKVQNEKRPGHRPRGATFAQAKDFAGLLDKMDNKPG